MEVENDLSADNSFKFKVIKMQPTICAAILVLLQMHTTR